MIKSTLKCGCIPDGSGYGYCGKCTKALRVKIWREMSEGRKAYDRYMDPNGSKDLDISAKYYDEDCCSCHINPPCGYCLNKDEDEE